MAAKDIEAGRAYVLLRVRDQLSQGLKIAEKKFVSFGNSVAKAGAVVSAGIGAGLAFPVKLAAEMEQATVSMEVFTGSAEVARKLMGSMEDMAARTPFEFDDLRNAGQLLMGFGATAEQVLPMLRMLGDVSGGNRERFERLSLAFGQVMAKGRLMGQEVMQMTEQGFNPLAEMSKLTGKSMAVLMKQMEDGQVSFPMLVAAFQSATAAGGRFHSMMEKQSGTLIGLMSTLMDYAKIAGRTVGEAVLPAIKAKTEAFIGVLKVLIPVIKANATSIGKFVRVVMTIGAIATVLTGVGLAISGAGLAAGFMASAIGGIIAAIGFIFSPLGLLTAVLIGLVGTAIYFRTAIAEAFQGLLIWASPVIEAFGRILWAGEGAVQGIVEALSAGQIQLAGTIAIAALKSMFYQAAAEIPGAGRLLATGFGQALLAGRWDLIVGMAMTKAKLWVSDTAAGIGAIWDMLVYGIRTGWHTASAAIASAMLWVVGKISSGITAITNLFDGMATGARIAAIVIKSLFTGSTEEAKTQSKLLLDEYNKRAQGRTSATDAFNSGAQKNLAEDAARVQAGITKDFQNNFAARAKGGEDLRAKLAQLEQEARNAALQGGTTTAADAAAKARKELDAAIAAAADAKAAKDGPGLPGNYVPGLQAKDQLPKVESRGTFSAAAALAFGQGTGAAEQTAQNTMYSRRYLKQLVDKPGAQFA